MNQYASPTYLQLSDAELIRVIVPADSYRAGDFIRIRTLNNVDTVGDTYRITGPMRQEIVNKDDYRIWPAERVHGDDIPSILRSVGFPKYE